MFAHNITSTFCSPF